MEWEHAAQRYRDRVTLAEKTNHPARSDIWFDYGVYCLRRGEHQRAEECLRSCIAIDPAHVPALQAYGALLVEKQSFEDAEVYLKGAIKAETVRLIACYCMCCCGLSNTLCCFVFHYAGRYWRLAGIDP